MKLKIHLLFILLFLIVSCKNKKDQILQSVNGESIEINTDPDSTILNIILPYQKEIENEMEEIITYSKTNLSKKGIESLLGNFVTDLCLNYADADVCVMNNGGLRKTIEKGPVKKRHIYELMPFENELVLLELNEKDYIGLIEYICKRGGEPFSGINITINDNKEIISYSTPVDFRKGEKVKVLTSDYLANGGDKMSFFKNKEQISIGIKLRDAIIDYCYQTDTIFSEIDGRIKITENE